MKRSNERSLAEVLDGLVDAYGIREKLDEREIVSQWERLTGAMISRHTTAMKLRRGKPLLNVDSAPLRHELSFMKEGLMALLNEHLGRAVVKEIVLE